MRKQKIFFAMLLGVVCLTGCSLFEKSESGEIDELVNALTNSEKSEIEQESNSEEYDTNNEITNEPEATLAGDEETSTVGESSSDTEEMKDTVLSTDTQNTVYTQGETSNISFKNGEMQSAVIAEITLDSIIRGDDAQYIIDMYNAENPENSIKSSADSTLEFCVVNYTVDLKAAEGVPEVSTEVQCSIGGSDLSTDLSFNGSTYNSFPTLYNPNGYTVTSGESGNGQIIFMLPVGCNSFSITFGDPTIQSATYLFE